MRSHIDHVDGHRVNVKVHLGDAKPELCCCLEKPRKIRQCTEGTLIEEPDIEQLESGGIDTSEKAFQISTDSSELKLLETTKCDGHFLSF